MTFFHTALSGFKQFPLNFPKLVKKIKVKKKSLEGFIIVKQVVPPESLKTFTQKKYSLWECSIFFPFWKVAAGSLDGFFPQSRDMLGLKSLKYFPKSPKLCLLGEGFELLSDVTKAEITLSLQNVCLHVLAL